jgi:trk system potassium uptake protein TrkA
MSLTFIQGDATDPATWAALETDTIRAVAVLLPSDEVNLQVCRFLKDHLGIRRVVSRVHDATQTPLFSELEVQVINPSLSPVVELEYLLLYPSVSSLMTDLEDEHDIAEIQLRCADLTGRPISEIDLPEGAMIVLVRRDGDVIYPRGHTVLSLGDRLTLVGSIEAVRELARRCE